MLHQTVVSGIKGCMSTICTLSGRRTIIEYITSKKLKSILNDTLPVTDDHIMEHYGNLITPVCVLKPGEQEKTQANLLKIIRELMHHEASRDMTLAAVGGGVICDITSLAASLYMRGMQLVLVPTTLLAMVDASVGGKTGVDYRGYKNLLGTFYPAGRVLICPELLGTLSEREFKNGLAEVIKHALLSGSPLYDTVIRDQKKILSRDTECLEQLIHHSLQVKINIVEQDPEEQLGIRQLLNFGHTFGHALESSTGLSFSHGEAVAWGMAKALEAGVLIGLTDKAYARDTIALLKSYGYPVDHKVEERELFMKSLKHDKKRRKQIIPFILQKQLADTVLYPLNLQVVEKIL